MTLPRVLIVEDDSLIALSVEDALLAAGFEVCGIAASETEALDMAEALEPDFAVVDVNLSPGDGRVVARELSQVHQTAVLFATGQCDEIQALEGAGAVACLPKPYIPDEVPLALRTIADIIGGHPPAKLPNHMIAIGTPSREG